MCRYELPVTDIREALNVLNPKFDINECPNAYVKFEELRSNDHLNSLKIQLNILNDSLFNNNDYSKILFTGHTGSGKTTELKKLDKYLNNADRYFTVFADVQDSFQITTFEQEDLYILLISKLVEKLNFEKIPFKQDKLNKLANDWIAEDREVENEIKKGIENNASLEAESGVDFGFMFWKLFSAKGNLKTAFSYDSSTSTKIRRKIKENKGEYIQRLNEILIEIRHAVINSKKGLDILFIIDGVERLRYEKYDVYVNTFFRDARLLQELNTNFICCVPIETRYDIHIVPLITGLYKTYELPLINLSESSNPYFSELINKRINKNDFFEQDVLEFIVQKSGGHPRQLIQLVEKALTYSIGNNGKINIEAAQKSCDETGRLLRRLLTAKHIEILQSGEFMNADKEVLELLFSLSLLEYNCTTNARKINPVLLPFINT